MPRPMVIISSFVYNISLNINGPVSFACRSRNKSTNFRLSTDSTRIMNLPYSSTSYSFFPNIRDCISTILSKAMFHVPLSRVVSVVQSRRSSLYFPSGCNSIRCRVKLPNLISGCGDNRLVSSDVISLTPGKVLYASIEVNACGDCPGAVKQEARSNIVKVLLSNQPIFDSNVNRKL